MNRWLQEIIASRDELEGANLTVPTVLVCSLVIHKMLCESCADMCLNGNMATISHVTRWWGLDVRIDDSLVSREYYLTTPRFISSKDRADFNISEKTDKGDKDGTV